MNSTANDNNSSASNVSATPSAPQQINNPVSTARVSGRELLGTLFIQEGHITPEQLRYAQRVQSKLATPQTLVQLLKELDYLTDEQLRQTLHAHQMSIQFGDLLVELGYLRDVELEAALKLQQEAKPKKKLGQILIENRFLSEDQIVYVLSFQFGFPQVEPIFAELDKALLSRGSMKQYKLHHFLPIKFEKSRVLVAFADPMDRNARGAAENTFGKAIIPAIITAGALERVLGQLERSSHQPHVTSSNDETTVVGIVNALFQHALQENASDIHIEPTPEKLKVRFRCDGILVPHKELPRELASALTSRIKILAKADIAEKRRHQDGRILFEDHQTGVSIDLRVSFYITIHGEKIVLRLLNKQGNLLNLSAIGMAPKMLEHFRFDVLDIPSGVVIITGPTGSGKTTTLYSCVNYLNQPHTSIITAEDPVEYVIDGISQCSINPKLNITFEETLRHIVRQDPDIIILGEVRDRFSAETAIQAALTGHKVLTTFHTEDSIGGILRLMNMEIEAFLISSTVVSIVAQRLVRRVCANCSAPYTSAPMELRRLGIEVHKMQKANLQRGRGCHQCRFTGYRGRISVFELLVLNEMVKDAILSHKTSYEIRRISLETSGLVTLMEDGIVKAYQGLTTLEEVIRHLPRLHKPRPLHELHQLLGLSS